MRLSSAVAAHLCSCAPVEPAHIRGVSEVGVDPGGDQHMALGLLILDNVVEVRASCQHGCLPQALTTQHH